MIGQTESEKLIVMLESSQEQTTCICWQEAKIKLALHLECVKYRLHANNYQYSLARSKHKTGEKGRIENWYKVRFLFLEDF